MVKKLKNKLRILFDVMRMEFWKLREYSKAKEKFVCREDTMKMELEVLKAQ